MFPVTRGRPSVAGTWNGSTQQTRTRLTVTHHGLRQAESRKDTRHYGKDYCIR